ncbi:MAG: hypothetical protein H6625_01015 [Bdellovibrionaceae bacterium]|nr:hypothetical protein [Pseudobdellovibrionaceae bacterium]
MNRSLFLIFIIYTFANSIGCSPFKAISKDKNNTKKVSNLDPLTQIQFRTTNDNPYEKHFQSLAEGSKIKLSELTSKLENLNKQKAQITVELDSSNNKDTDKIKLLEKLDMAKKALAAASDATEQVSANKKVESKNETCKPELSNRINFYKRSIRLAKAKEDLKKVVILQSYFLGTDNSYKVENDPQTKKLLSELGIEINNLALIGETLEKLYEHLNKTINQLELIAKSNTEFTQPVLTSKTSKKPELVKINAIANLGNPALANSVSIDNLNEQLKKANKEKEACMSADEASPTLQTNTKPENSNNTILTQKIQNIKKQLSEIDKPKDTESNEKLKQKMASIQTELDVVQTQINHLSESDKISAEFLNSLIKLIELKNSLFAKFQNKKPINMTDIVELHTLEHLLLDQETKFTSYKMFNDTLDFISKMSSEKIKNDLGEFKKSYENYIEKTELKDKPIMYNSSYTTLNSPIEHGRVQSYSGTLLFFRLLFSQLNEINIKGKALVVIIEDGYISPGYVSQGELYGFETTAKGKALVQYGSTANIHGRISVYEAKQFLFAELFKWQIKDFNQLQKQMETFVISNLGFRKNALMKPAIVKISEVKDFPLASQTPFSLGVTDIENEDLERETFEIKKSSFFIKK